MTRGLLRGPSFISRYSRGVLIVGLTGGIGAGKSTAASIFASLGAVVIDADEIARDVLAPGRPALDLVAKRFGEELIVDGVLNRESLAKIVFSDDQARADLEAITHPLIRQRFEELVAQQKPDAVVIHDVPLLFERQLQSAYDLVITVEAPLEVRKERLEARGVSPEQIAQRMAAQATDDQRRSGSDIVISNAGDEAALRREIEQIWRERLLPTVRGL